MDKDQGIVRFRGEPALALANAAGDRAMVLLHGAHVVSWTPAGGRDWLYLSPRSSFGEGSAVRGGVPVIFPQFNRRGPDFTVPRHGFARTRRWRLLEHAGDAVVLQLVDDDETRASWPHRFALRLEVRLAPGQLALEVTTENTDDAPFAFTAALHTYLAVADVCRASVAGLEGVRFLDAVTGAEGTGPAAALRFEGETDVIWYDLPRPLRLDTPDGALEVAMSGFADSVVWNPWAERAAALPDMPGDDYRRMLCIEAAAIGRPVELAPGARWAGRQVLTAG